MKNLIIVIEDMEEDAIKIKNTLEEYMEKNQQSNCQFEIEWLHGEKEVSDGNDKVHSYYDDSVIEAIAMRKKQAEEEGKKVGILLDILLTQEETETAGNLVYPKVDLAKKIYFQYKDIIPIYIVTSINYFGAQCDAIMGADLSKCYVTKSALLDYKMQGSIEKMFDFYKKEFQE